MSPLGAEATIAQAFRAKITNMPTEHLQKPAPPQDSFSGLSNANRPLVFRRDLSGSASPALQPAETQRAAIGHVKPEIFG